ncbi:hypothetical protein HN51_019038, partial [Arachis hypogaea]
SSSLLFLLTLSVSLFRRSSISLICLTVASHSRSLSISSLVSQSRSSLRHRASPSSWFQRASPSSWFRLPRHLLCRLPHSSSLSSASPFG